MIHGSVGILSLHHTTVTDEQMQNRSFCYIVWVEFVELWRWKILENWRTGRS